MITERGNYTVGRVPADYIGLSTDAKPTNVPNTSTFYEMDTKKVFFFDEQNAVWVEQ